MKFSQEFGIPLDDDILSILFRAKEIAGPHLAKNLGVSYANLSNWLGKNKRKGRYITWDLWEKIRPWLIAHNLITANDPRWLLPSEMRKALMQRSNVIAYGASAMAAGRDVNNSTSDVLLDSALDAVLATDGFCDPCRLLAIRCIRAAASSSSNKHQEK